MRNFLPLLLVLLAFLTAGELEAQSRQGGVLSTFGNGDGDRFGATVSISNDGTRIAVMAPDNGRFGTSSPQAEVYELQGGSWVKLGETFTDYFVSTPEVEATVTLSGNGTTVATGEPAFNGPNSQNDAGRIVSYRISGGSWSTIGNVLTGGHQNAQHGKKVILIKNGAQMMTANFGGTAADPLGVFNRILQAGNWIEVGSQPILQSNSEEAISGIALSDQGLVVALGLDKGANLPGEVQRFRFTQDWVSLGSVNGTVNGDGFGESIAMANNGFTTAIGAPSDGTGKVRVYDNNNSQVGATLAGQATDQAFGFSVDLSEDGTRLAVGAPANDPTLNGMGRVYVYDLVGGNWSLQYTFNGTVAGEHTGQSVSISDDGMFLAIGRPGYETGGQSDAGQVDVFILDGSVGTQAEPLLDVEVYPNPTSNVLNVRGVSLTTAKVEVRDALGRLVESSILGNDVIDVKMLTTGSYFLKIETEDGIGNIPFIKE